MCLDYSVNDVPGRSKLEAMAEGAKIATRELWG